MPEKELSSAPGMVPLFVRAGAGAIPGASRLPFVSGGGGRELPDVTLVLGDVHPDRDRVARYDRVCGFDVSDTLPPTYPHMLAFPMQLSLMTDGSFPFPAIGLVHITNEIVQHRPIRASEELRIKVWATNLRDHPRGRQFDLRSEVRSSGQLVWEETSTNLKRGGRNEDAPKPPEPPSAEDLTPSATWELPGDLGRRYGAVSGDLNPIHMHPLTARLFGFPSAIAHGMWTKARCLAALEARLTDRFTARAAFRKPIMLPTKVQFAEQESATGIQFGVLSEKGDSHLDGELTFG
jgi:acyl dehydratase